ncbi:MAG: hypothetical protein HYW77_03390 [Parcubacteria group bacterium]|nr:hypothetical protein [Parcubacteria group bacterium]
MFIPKVIFLYAYPLDGNRRSLFKNKNFGNYPEMQTVKDKVGEWQKLWDKFNSDDKMVKRIIELTGVALSHDINVYVIGDGLTAMSTPFILPIMTQGSLRTNDGFIETVVHELTHIFISSTDDKPQVKNYWQFLRKTYKDEAVKTQNHIMVYAVVETILEEVFGKEKMRELIQIKNPEYQRAIDIVDKKSPAVIIEEFNKLTGN